jgi:hypothetical protein
MKRILPFTLSFFLASILGIIPEMTYRDVYEYYVDEVAHGKPMPPVSEWIWQIFARWDNGSIYFLFQIPWVLLLLYDLLAPRQLAPADRSMRLLYGFLCFALLEMILFVFFVFHAIFPYITRYIRANGEDGGPAIVYLPHFILLAGILAVMIVGLRRRWKVPAQNGEAGPPA